MPSRIVREGILTSRRIAALTPYAELFYRKLMSVVDDNGRIEVDLSVIKTRCYPFADDMRVAEISDYLAECTSGEEPLIHLYKVGPKTYLEYDIFGQQIRSKSKYPSRDKDEQAKWIADSEQRLTSKRPQGEVWATIRSFIFERDNWTCKYCGTKGGLLHCDHIHPLSRGGTNDYNNLATACAPCNLSKSAKTIEEWTR